MPLFLLLVLLPLLVILLQFAYSLIWVPWKIQRHFQRQGVRGPGYRPIFGNAAEIRRLYSEAQPKSPDLADNDVVGSVSPFYYRWSRMYGKNFLYWFGPKPRLAIADQEMIKTVLMNTSGSFGTVPQDPLSKPLFAQGLVGLEGEQWALHRRIANQAFSLERIQVNLATEVLVPTSF